MLTHIQEELISAYLDGMLDVAQMRDVSLHLRQCPECSSVYSAFAKNKERLQQMPVPAGPSADFWDNAFRAIRVDERQQQAKRERWSWAPAGNAGRRRVALAGVTMALAGIFVATPVFHTHPTVDIASVRPAADVIDPSDLASLVQAHAQSVAQQPLADGDRQAMLAADAEVSTADLTGDAGVDSDSM